MIKKVVSILLFVCPLLFAQQKDTTFAAQDTLASKKKENAYGIDAVVYSSAQDSILFKVKQKKMDLYGKGLIKYKSTDLKSANIYIDFNSSNMKAEGVQDSTDSLGVRKFRDTPVLTEGGEVYQGHNIDYNYKSQRGLISLAKSATDGTVYYGDKVKKLDKETYFIKDGEYTTCTAEEKHYYFYAREMKVIMKEQIIAKWIWLYVGGVPLPIPLPFGVFPNQSGRRSGIIAPAYGQREGMGQYFSHFGYFFALSDYMDLTTTADYYTKGGYALNGRVRYAKRYNFSGNIDAGFARLKLGESSDPDYTVTKDWRLSLSHAQQIDPTMRFDANLSFQSSNYNRNTSSNYNDLLTQNIFSNASFFKTWEESGNSISVNYSRSQNLQNGNISEVLPSLRFSSSQSYPFRKSGQFSSEQKWYELLGYNYSGEFLNNRSKAGGKLEVRGGIQHNIGISFAPKLGYFSIMPNISYNEKWYNKRIKKEYVKNQISKRDSLVDNRINEINMVRDFSIGVSASTKLYGIFNANALGIEAFRHTLMPAISYGFRPDFSAPKWGYYGTYVDTAGKLQKYDKFSEEVFSGPGAGEQQSISFSLGNVFEIKTMKDPTDTTSQSQKIQLLNLNAGISYNFAADSLKLSDLSLSYRTQIGEYLSLSGGSTYSFYDYVDNGSSNRYKGPVNKTLLSQKKGLMRLTSFNFSLNTSISGEKLKSKEEKKSAVQDEDEFTTARKSNYQALYGEETPDLAIPWELSMGFSYYISKYVPSSRSETASLNANFGLNLTKSWKLSFMGSYDFIEKEITAPQVRVYKDLHDWEMNFTWNPLGTYRGYRFEIRIKAPQLQDLKVTRARGLFSGR